MLKYDFDFSFGMFGGAHGTEREGGLSAEEIVAGWQVVLLLRDC